MPKITPIRIEAFDQIKLPNALAFLDCFLASNRCLDAFMFFIPNQLPNLILRHRPFWFFAVLLDAAKQIGGYAGVDRAITLRWQDANEADHGSIIMTTG